MNTELLIHNAAQLLTLAGGPQRGEDLGTLGLIEDGAVAIGQGKLLAVGPSEELIHQYQPLQTIDASGKVVLPGFVDPHTHLVWSGNRAAEFEMRIQGSTYKEIMAAGGGIASTVRQTRKSDVESLIDEATPRVYRMLEHGTTTAEAKTGYGLETKAEIRMLEAILRLDDEGPLDLTATFLGAHAVPLEFAERKDVYVDLVCDEMLPAVHSWWDTNGGGRPLPFVDVFCETGAFTLEQSERVLTRGRDLGFPLKIHSDEFDGLGGTGLAVRLGAVSADHLVHTPPEDIAALGRSETIAVALPCTPFGLAESAYTPAKAILEAGGILALATDLNPGTAWCENMQFAIALACRYMGLTPAQAIATATINAAAAINRQDSIGSLEVGKQADLVILDAPDFKHLGYQFGTNLVSAVVKKGSMIFSRGRKDLPWNFKPS